MEKQGKLNADIMKSMNDGIVSLSYRDWLEANKEAVKEQAPKDKKPRLEYVSEITKQLINERDVALKNGNLWMANLKRGQIKMQLRRDKVNCIDALIHAELNCKDNSEGVKITRSEYKPKRYAKRDREGNLVDLEKGQKPPKTASRTSNGASRTTSTKKTRT